MLHYTKIKLDKIHWTKYTAYRRRKRLSAMIEYTGAEAADRHSNHCSHKDNA